MTTVVRTKEKIALTPKQREIIRKVRRGWVFITNTEAAWIAGDDGQEQVPLKTFFNMVKKGLIAQEIGYPFNYGLTKLGQTIPT